MSQPKVRTWSRQTAFCMFLGCGLLAYNGQIEELKIVIWPVAIFGLAAFGLRQPTVASWMQRP